FIAVGATKNIDDRWGVAIELSHAFKTTKRLEDIRIFGNTVENRTDISRSSFRVMATYRL
ncbi:MAG: hypothetical protein LBQ08_02535, partial [Holosporaceae bacterium]|nr:hypothetical protein [Holosporaceae bacterium]